MPGSVSDSYDPEFGTGENADAVREAVVEVRQKLTDVIGSDALKDILDVVRGDNGKGWSVKLTEREIRIIRFGLNRALESL